MELYIDTEFNGFQGQLISMALVPAVGPEWYQVCELPRYGIDPWVAEHVVPVLRKDPTDRDSFHASMKAYLEQFDNVTVYADWYTDLAWFFMVMSGRDHRSSYSFPCRTVLLKDVPDLSPEIPHNALSDARALRAWHLCGRI